MHIFIIIILSLFAFITCCCILVGKKSDEEYNMERQQKYDEMSGYELMNDSAKENE